MVHTRTWPELHGALLDARLLAEVYVNMARGQGTLVIDADDTASLALHGLPTDLIEVSLPVLLASDKELAAHHVLLAEIDKASGGKALWRRGSALQ